ncbi:MAG: hypothetical protein L0H74_02640 [Brachybacterium sp.]|nr:hypothetical protein [Brachybacterium sp.]
MRSVRNTQLGRVLAELSDTEIAALLADGEPLGIGIGGSTARVQLDGELVFVKQIPLTPVERADVRSTAHRSGLPMACHYGIGSPGFGAGRELAAHELTSRWVHDEESDIFPLLLHSRPLDRPCRTDTSEFEGLTPQQQWGEGWPRVVQRVDALRDAESSMTLFLEYLPETLGAWLRRQFAAGAHTGGAAFADALEQIIDASVWMRAHGLRHLDLHPGNILVDRERLLFTDFGLTMHESFDLDREERAFFDLHAEYDHDTGVTSLLHWTLAELGAGNRARRTALVNSTAKYGMSEELERLCAPLEGAAHLVVEHAQTAAVITEMFELLIRDASATSYDMITAERERGAEPSGQ